MAGINAGLLALGRPPLVISRADGFVGVMIDDLIVKGAEEPCESQSKRPARLTPIVRSHVHIEVGISDDHQE